VKKLGANPPSVIFTQPQNEKINNRQTDENQKYEKQIAWKIFKRKFKPSAVPNPTCHQKQKNHQ